MQEQEDKELVSTFLETKSEKAFRQLYRRYTKDLYGLAVHLTYGNRSVSEDRVQEMWARAVFHLPGFKWQSSLKTWLSGILINCCKEYHRRQGGQNADLEALENKAGSQARPEQKIDLQKALASLPEGYREVLVLHDLEGYKHEEIGALLGISEGTSKSQLFHARKRIKELL